MVRVSFAWTDVGARCAAHHLHERHRPNRHPPARRFLRPVVSKPPGPFVVGAGTRQTAGARSPTLEESTMTATYTFDVFTTLDGYGSYDEHGDWGGYWGKHGPELLDRRARPVRRAAADGLRGHHLPGVRGDAGLEHRGDRCRRLVGHPDEEHADDGGVEHAGRAPRLAGRDRRAAVTPSTSSPGSRRSPTCRCARTAACR